VEEYPFSTASGHLRRYLMKRERCLQEDVCAPSDPHAFRGSSKSTSKPHFLRCRFSGRRTYEYVPAHAASRFLTTPNVLGSHAYILTGENPVNLAYDQKKFPVFLVYCGTAWYKPSCPLKNQKREKMLHHATLVIFVLALLHNKLSP